MSWRACRPRPPSCLVPGPRVGSPKMAAGGPSAVQEERIASSTPRGPPSGSPKMAAGGPSAVQAGSSAPGKLAAGGHPPYERRGSPVVRRTASERQAEDGGWGPSAVRGHAGTVELRRSVSPIRLAAERTGTCGANRLSPKAPDRPSPRASHTAVSSRKTSRKTPKLCDRLVSGSQCSATARAASIFLKPLRK